MFSLSASTCVRAVLAPLAAVLCQVAGGPVSAQAAAQSCDEIVAGIEARIRAGGVSQFSLDVVDAAASAPGRLVGTCGRGSKRIVYVAGGPRATVPAAAAPATAAARPAPGSVATPTAAAAPAAKPQPQPKPAPRDPILTECLDGSVSLGGDCKP